MTTIGDRRVFTRRRRAINIQIGKSLGEIIKIQRTEPTFVTFEDVQQVEEACRNDKSPAFNADVDGKRAAGGDAASPPLDDLLKSDDLADLVAGLHCCRRNFAGGVITVK
ncbi:hypothetical protein E3N88_41115 [Mikania micrantha]|uniref:Uncharacterized protein n=1 Tax=Mikania micrantha TaxID=192012 RepID=A0A5N6LRW7_9ASTR|nr:hypothetical protein E3N88_41115 [Mikania micrantha]